MKTTLLLAAIAVAVVWTPTPQTTACPTPPQMETRAMEKPTKEIPFATTKVSKKPAVTPKPEDTATVAPLFRHSFL